MNFAKNTICLQCDAKRPKRQLLPGEWECPRLAYSFLLYFGIQFSCMYYMYRVHTAGNPALSVIFCCTMFHVSLSICKQSSKLKTLGI
jgi:hypothetical protein